LVVKYTKGLFKLFLYSRRQRGVYCASRLSIILGRLPNAEEYQEYAANINATAADTYRYLNFHKMPHYTHKADKVIVWQTVV